MQWRRRLLSGTNRLAWAVKTPKALVLLVLSGLTLLGLLAGDQTHALINLAAALATVIIIDFGVSMMQGSVRFASAGSTITALIVTGILSAATWPLFVIFATAAASLSKHLFKSKRRPLFNPAVFGLFVTALIFPVEQNWWISLPLLSPWFIAVLIAAGIYIARRVNKLSAVYVYLGTYFLLLFLIAVLHIGLSSNVPRDALRPPFLNAALFLALFMLTDPPTSPVTVRQQVYFGFIAAVIGTIDFVLQGGLIYLFVGLLAANVWKAWVNRRRSRLRNGHSSGPISGKGGSRENWYV